MIYHKHAHARIAMNRASGTGAIRALMIGLLTGALLALTL